ncbi:MAG TPA: recombinase RecA [Planctomycetota bacterium]|nr:recombinase RecA [Planctomycetota bacterium]
MPAKKAEEGKDGRRDQALERAMAQIEKEYGKGSIMRLGSHERADVAVIPTGSLSLDIALGVGGLPRGRVVEIYGPEASGKTTLTLHCVANAQRQGGIAAFVDTEHALDTLYARRLGVDVDNLLVSQPDTGEQALNIAEMLVRSNAVDILVVDSVAALVPQSELEGQIGDAQMGAQARLMSQALRKLSGVISKTHTCMVFTNQLRMKIGVMFGNPETTSGGRALRFYASVRIDIRRIGAIKSGDEIIGNRTRATVAKNKVAPPFRKAEFDIIYNRGIDRCGEIIDLGVAANFLDRAGAWISYGDLRLGQGREKAIDFLRENPKIAQEIENKIRATGPLAPVAADDSGGEE